MTVDSIIPQDTGMVNIFEGTLQIFLLGPAF